MHDAEVITQFSGDLASWLADQAHQRGLDTLLAFADDGVIWGKLEQGQWILSGKVFPAVEVALRSETLREVHLFSQKGELLMWRSTSGFSYRFIGGKEEPHGEENVIEGVFRLWGIGKSVNNGFTLMEEGQQGFLHAPPVANALECKAQLRVRHYIAYDDDGQASVMYSRLVALEVIKE